MYEWISKIQYFSTGFPFYPNQLAMKKENIIEIWDWADIVFILSSLFMLSRNFFCSMPLTIIFIVSLLLLGIIGFFVKFRYGLKWRSTLVIESSINLVFGILLIYFYIMR